MLITADQALESRKGRPGGETDPADRDEAAHRRDGVVGDHPSSPDHHDPPGQCLDLLQVVTGQHNRAALGVERPDTVPKGSPGLDVQPGGGLVEEHDPRPADERQGDGETSLLTAGQAAGLTPYEIGETESIEQLTSFERVVEVGADEVDDLAHAQRGGQAGLLWSDAECAPGGRPARIAAAQLDPAGGGPADAGQ